MDWKIFILGRMLPIDVKDLHKSESMFGFIKCMLLIF
jgi:hypothetical protein